MARSTSTTPQGSASKVSPSVSQTDMIAPGACIKRLQRTLAPVAQAGPFSLLEGIYPARHRKKPRRRGAQPGLPVPWGNL